MEVIEKELERHRQEEESRLHENGHGDTNGNGTTTETAERGASPVDPLGVAAFDDLFTTISDTLPQHNAAFSAISDNDL